MKRSIQAVWSVLERQNPSRHLTQLCCSREFKSSRRDGNGFPSLSAPREDRRGGIIPYCADERAGTTRQPPSVIALKDDLRNADVGDYADAAYQVKREQSR